MEDAAHPLLAAVGFCCGAFPGVAGGLGAGLMPHPFRSGFLVFFCPCGFFVGVRAASFGWHLLGVCAAFPVFLLAHFFGFRGIPGVCFILSVFGAS